MLEIERGSEATKRVREKASSILRHNRDLLFVHESNIETVLKPQLENFKKQGNEKDPHLRNELSLENELGLNLFFNTVNFCFKEPLSGKEYGYRAKDGTVIKRSTGLFVSMAESGINWNNLGEVVNLTQEKWLDVTQLSSENILYQGPDRIKRITGFAGFLTGLGFQTVEEFLKEADYDAAKIIESLKSSGYFDDEFLKRAQVGVKGIDNVLLRRGVKGLSHMDELTCMADYRIPQVFYNLDIVRIAPALRNKLEKGIVIESASPEEEVLRATVVYIGTRLSKLMGINESEVDELLWNLSQKMAKYGLLAIPHMLVATDKY